MYRVIASDLDGTLLDPSSAVDPVTASTLRQVEARGLHLVLATGRHYLDASCIGRALEIRAHLITANGARVHGPDGEPMFAQDIDPEIARTLLGGEIVGGTLAGLFTEEEWLVSRPCPELDAYFRVSGFAARARDLAAHDGAGVFKVAYMGAASEIARIEAQIVERFGERVCLTSATRNTVEVMAGGVSKGSALTVILDRLGVPSSACVAFGDDRNDIEMLTVAGRPYVMSGSSRRLLDALPGASLAGSNADAAVARTLRDLLGLSG